MSAHKKESTINLLPQTSFVSSTSGRILTWILSTFRVIVIVTEIIVMVAFLSRFWLDAQNSDLSEELETKESALLASRQFEEQFKNTQKRLSVFSILTEERFLISSKVRKISDYLPDGVILTNVTFNDKAIVVDGASDSELNIMQYITNLQEEKDFEKLILSKLATRKEDIKVLEFTLELKKEEPKPSVTPTPIANET